jgi:hypothetical protein
MKPTSPEQLARLLDQLSASYPNGIPLSVIQVSVESVPHTEEVSTSRPYHIFIAGDEGNLSSAAKELLTGITSKGLKISNDDYAVSYGTSTELAELASTSPSTHVVVFGADRETGWAERSDGRGILFTDALEQLVHDAARKKELWRQLQAILGRM